MGTLLRPLLCDGKNRSCLTSRGKFQLAATYFVIRLRFVGFWLLMGAGAVWFVIAAYKFGRTVLDQLAGDARACLSGAALWRSAIITSHETHSHNECSVRHPDLPHRNFPALWIEWSYLRSYVCVVESRS